MGLNEVFKKVADIERNATELASEKVELATPDDLAKAQMQSKKELDAANTLAKNVMASIDKVIAAYRTNQVTCNLGLAAADDVTRKFKDLGMTPPPAYIVSGKKELEASQKLSAAKVKALENAKKLFN
jgi:hypothetical protein